MWNNIFSAEIIDIYAFFQKRSEEKFTERNKLMIKKKRYLTPTEC